MYIAAAVHWSLSVRSIPERNTSPKGAQEGQTEGRKRRGGILWIIFRGTCSYIRVVSAILFDHNAGRCDRNNIGPELTFFILSLCFLIEYFFLLLHPPHACIVRINDTHS